MCRHEHPAVIPNTDLDGLQCLKNKISIQLEIMFTIEFILSVGIGVCNVVFIATVIGTFIFFLAVKEPYSWNF